MANRKDKGKQQVHSTTSSIMDESGLEKDSHPPNSFLNYLRSYQFPPFPQAHSPINLPPPLHFVNAHQSTENLHFVGVPSHHLPFSPPTTSLGQNTPPSMMRNCKLEAPSPTLPSQKKDKVDSEVDVLEEPAGRTNKRLSWTIEEEIRLVSAWLNNSNDPIGGNSKKLEQYWDEVSDEYNSTTPKNRKREAVQLKAHWHRLKTKISNFNACWKAVTSVYQSGKSDDQYRDMAMKKYQLDHKGPFKHYELWKILRDQPKWCTYVKALEGQTDKLTDVIDVEAAPIGRPIGTKAAKAERKGKRKASDVPEAVVVLGEQIDKLIDVKATSRQDKDKLMEVQQRVSSEKLQTARMYKEAKMLEVYQNLLLADTSSMDDDAKAHRSDALETLKASLFGPK